MKTYTYQSCTGANKEIEISDGLHKVLSQMDKAWERNERKNTRRHYSTTVYVEGDREPHDIDIPSQDEDCIVVEERKVSRERLQWAMQKLSPKQQELHNLYFIQGLTTYEIADLKGISRPAISQQLKTLKKKIEKFS